MSRVATFVMLSIYCQMLKSDAFLLSQLPNKWYFNLLTFFKSKAKWCSTFFAMLSSDGKCQTLQMFLCEFLCANFNRFRDNNVQFSYRRHSISNGNICKRNFYIFANLRSVGTKLTDMHTHPHTQRYTHNDTDKAMVII